MTKNIGHCTRLSFRPSSGKDTAMSRATRWNPLPARVYLPLPGREEDGLEVDGGLGTGEGVLPKAQNFKKTTKSKSVPERVLVISSPNINMKIQFISVGTMHGLSIRFHSAAHSGP